MGLWVTVLRFTVYICGLRFLRLRFTGAQEELPSPIARLTPALCSALPGLRKPDLPLTFRGTCSPCVPAACGSNVYTPIQNGESYACPSLSGYCSALLSYSLTDPCDVCILKNFFTFHTRFVRVHFLRTMAPQNTLKISKARTETSLGVPTLDAQALTLSIYIYIYFRLVL